MTPRGAQVPYPFQNNVWLLPGEDLEKCLVGLVECVERKNVFDPPKNFEDFIFQCFGFVGAQIRVDRGSM